MPDRHIFAVAADGSTQPTGATASPEPSRAIAAVGHAPPPALEAPPPSLSVPAEDPKRAKPTRRRRTPRATVGGELEGGASALALPAPEEKPKRTRKKADTPTPAAQSSTASTAEKPKRKRKAAVATSRKKSS
jgi:hypothetical protein